MKESTYRQGCPSCSIIVGYKIGVMCNKQHRKHRLQTKQRKRHSFNRTAAQILSSHRWVIECTYHQGCTHITLYNVLCTIPPIHGSNLLTTPRPCDWDYTMVCACRKDIPAGSLFIKDKIPVWVTTSYKCSFGIQSCPARNPMNYDCTRKDILAFLRKSQVWPLLVKLALPGKCPALPLEVVRDSVPHREVTCPPL